MKNQKKTKIKISKMARREEIAGYLFLLPNMVGFFIFTLVPVVWGLLLSLTNYDGFSDAAFLILRSCFATTIFIHRCEIIFIIP